MFTKEKLNSETDGKTKNVIIANRVHKLKAQVFFPYLKSEDTRLQCFPFDCQKILALPEVPDQSTYFSQQVNLYNLQL